MGKKFQQVREPPNVLERVYNTSVTCAMGSVVVKGMNVRVVKGDGWVQGWGITNVGKDKIAKSYQETKSL